MQNTERLCRSVLFHKVLRQAPGIKTVLEPVRGRKASVRPRDRVGNFSFTRPALSGIIDLPRGMAGRIFIGVALRSGMHGDQNE